MEHIPPIFLEKFRKSNTKPNSLVKKICYATAFKIQGLIFVSTPFWYNALLAIAKPIYRWKIKQRAESEQQFQLEIRQRFGDFLPVKNKNALWIHAVSVGETNAVQAVIEHYLQQGQPILLTNTTKTGQARANSLFNKPQYQQLFQAVFLPVDQKSVIDKFLAKYQPKVLALVETELWANLLHQTRAKGIPSLLLNGRLSAKSAEKYAKVPSLTRPMLQQLSFLLAQDLDTRKRFLELGMPEERIQVTGNLKFDLSVPEQFHHQIMVLRQQWNIKERYAITLASTHAPEEQQLLSRLAKHLQQHPELVCIVVPRHPERFNEVFNLSQQLGLRTHRRSLGEDIQADTQVYLADSMGEMWLWYGLSRTCFVGGSLNETGGGHNILEPMLLSVPTVTGHKYHNFQTIVDELKEVNAIKIADDFDHAVKCLLSDLSDVEQAKRQVQQAKLVLQRNQGALKWHINAIDQALSSR